MTATVLLYVTVPDRDEALRIGRIVVSERLAGCANVLDGMTSVYHWNNELQESAEAVLLLKAPRDLASAVVKRVCELHPYEVPAVLVLPVEAGFQPFLNWIAAETETPEIKQA